MTFLDADFNGKAFHGHNEMCVATPHTHTHFEAQNNCKTPSCKVKHVRPEILGAWP